MKNAKKVTVPVVRLNIHQLLILEYVATFGRDGRDIQLAELVALFDELSRDGLKSTKYTARARASAWATNSLRRMRAAGIVKLETRGVYTITANGLALFRKLSRQGRTK